MLPPSHLQSFDALYAWLRGMSKSQSSNVDGRCDGAETSIRDQRVGTSYSDSCEGRCVARVRHAVETIHKPLRASENTLRLLGKR